MLQNLPLLRLLLYSFGVGVGFPIQETNHSRFLPAAWALPLLAVSSSGRLYHTLPQGPALSSFSLQMDTCGERPHNFHWCSLLPSSLTRTSTSWGSGVGTLRGNGCSQHPQGQPLWVAFCWAVSHGRAWAWEPIGRIPATHLVPRLFLSSSPRCLDRITETLCD